MARYGSGDDEMVITEYLDAHLENGIKQKNLDFVLDLMDLYVDLVESLVQKGVLVMSDYYYYYSQLNKNLSASMQVAKVGRL